MYCTQIHASLVAGRKATHMKGQVALKAGTTCSVAQVIALDLNYYHWANQTCPHTQCPDACRGPSSMWFHLEQADYVYVVPNGRAHERLWVQFLPPLLAWGPLFALTYGHTCSLRPFFGLAQRGVSALRWTFEEEIRRGIGTLRRENRQIEGIKLVGAMDLIGDAMGIRCHGDAKREIFLNILYWPYWPA